MISESLPMPPADYASGTLKRRVFFIAGFDPRGVKGYHQRIAEALGSEFSVGPPERRGEFETVWMWEGAEVRTTFAFLHWDDIVARHWRAKGRLGAEFAALRVLLVYARCGLLARARDGARAVRWALLVMGLAPVVLNLAALAFALLVGMLGAWTAPYGGWAASLPALALALWAGDYAWRRLNLEWLAKGFAAIVETAKREAPAWDERCAAFADIVAAAERKGEDDEIVVIGHSLGAILAMKALAAYLARGGRPRRRIAFVTLGNIIPFYTWLEPDRCAMRQGEAVAASPYVEWIDVTSGSDPASACRMGPLVGANATVLRWEPAFHDSLAPERFRYIRRRPLDFHFQYLKRADIPGGFDLIRMMSQPAPFFAGTPR